MIAVVFLILLGFYLVAGIVFAVPFVLFGVKKIDPRAASASCGFRLVIVPGATALWPLLLGRWVAGVHKPPEESTAHRQLAHSETCHSSPVTPHPR